MLLNLEMKACSLISLFKAVFQELLNQPGNASFSWGWRDVITSLGQVMELEKTTTQLHISRSLGRSKPVTERGVT